MTELENNVHKTIEESVQSVACTINKTINFLILLIGVLAILLFGTNAMWLHAWMQYDYEVYDVTQDGEGVNSVNTGEMGDLIYGTESEDY